MTRVDRTGPLGALMDEYERATRELAGIVAPLSGDDLDTIRDPETEDEDCRSIRTVTHHVVRAGFGYADMIRKAFGEEIRRPVIEEAASGADVTAQLDRMLVHTEATFEGRWDLSEDDAYALRIDSPWGPVYDLEQMFEHAIVHVLRHRRQIERWLG